MIVTFWKYGEERFCTWQADRGKRRIVPGTVWGDAQTLTHDLAGLVVEGSLGLSGGFWACVEAGATFSSTGRRRTQPGRDIIRTRRQELHAAEQAAHAHVDAWRRHAPTPAAEALDAMWSHWAPLGDYEPLVVEWPTLQLKPAGRGSLLQRPPKGRRRQRAARAHGYAGAR